eukprot:gene24912-biopygen10294
MTNVSFSLAVTTVVSKVLGKQFSNKALGREIQGTYQEASGGVVPSIKGHTQVWIFEPWFVLAYQVVHCYTVKLPLVVWNTFARNGSLGRVQHKEETQIGQNRRDLHIDSYHRFHFTIAVHSKSGGYQHPIEMEVRCSVAVVVWGS